MSLDIDRRFAVIRHPIGYEQRAVPYNQAVISVGIESSTFGLPGNAEQNDSHEMRRRRSALRK